MPINPEQSLDLPNTNTSQLHARRIEMKAPARLRCLATVSLDTDVNCRQAAFNPAEAFLAAPPACMIRGIERVMPVLNFDLRGVEVHLRGIRQDSPPKMTSIDYELIVDTDENDHRLDLLHQNFRRCGTISNTATTTTRLQGVVRSKI
jgi:uncharacterized OsmC-like protein